jgi:hypothetical protein
MRWFYADSRPSGQPARRALSTGLAEHVGEAIGPAAQFGGKNQLAVVVGRVGKVGRLTFEDETCGLEIRAYHCRIDAVQFVDDSAGIASWADMVDHQQASAWTHPGVELGDERVGSLRGILYCADSQ